MPSAALSISRRQPSSRTWMYGDVFTATPAYTSFVGSNATITLRSVLAPDRKFNAVLVVENSAAATHALARASQPLTLAAVPYLHVVYMKRIKGARNGQVVLFDSAAGSDVSVIVDLTSGHILQAAATTGSFSGASARVKPVGNGWFEIHLMYTGVVDTGLWFVYRLVNGIATNYTGDSDSSMAVWGTRLSLGST